MAESENKSRMSWNVKAGQVFLRADGSKAVAGKDHVRSEPVEILGDRPHFDGDFSYVCGSEHCRCMQ